MIDNLFKFTSNQLLGILTVAKMGEKQVSGDVKQKVVNLYHFESKESMEASLVI